MEKSEALAVAESYFECLNNNDWDAMRELWQPDGEWKAPGARRRRGIDEVLDYFRRCFAPWPEHADIPHRILVDGDAVVAEIEFHGVTMDGRGIQFDAVDVFDLREGKIAKISNWYDIDYARKALTPPPPPPP